jgi:hypothetical protein
MGHVNIAFVATVVANLITQQATADAQRYICHLNSSDQCDPSMMDRLRAGSSRYFHMKLIRPSQAGY